MEGPAWGADLATSWDPTRAGRPLLRGDLGQDGDHALGLFVSGEEDVVA